MAHRDRLEQLLTLPAHISYWVISAAILLGFVGDVTGSDVSSLFGKGFQEKFQPYTKPASIIVPLFLFVAVLHLILKTRSDRKRWRDVFVELHDCLDTMSSLAETVRLKISESKNWSRKDSDEFKALIAIQYREIATKICNVFCAYTQSDCHVSFKTLDGAGMISTEARDHSQGSIERRTIDEHLELFSYEKNTAFKNILEKPQVDCYIANHLRARYWLGVYYNANEGWPGLYYAVAVAPITTAHHPAEISRSNTYGFLCVDNRAGGFDKSVCRELLTHVAKRLLILTVLLAQVHITESQAGKESS